ncbi:hypothetical protein H310_04257 [Aphanomyces invadans]|uniref:Uncharacterized protein n=1 Tax=Aphanomyces invadans TaxID=157072 RepID=A0A024UG92_9STRA|nr:hypothetical protein H310_04257 [Aphanomyces invadans]ETW05304.1 hypothetical protein H310_04257 [Aphanomyces invadans]|eukprot:XP_008866742.1 hypothetical protein H310_04257 [Aphanomyces invadans]
MSDAMAFNSHVGQDSLIAQWTLCMSFFQSVLVSWIQSCIVVCHSEVVVDGLAIFYLRLSRHTIEALFPHLLLSSPRCITRDPSCHSLRPVGATLVAGPDCGGRLRAALCVGENMKNP